ncbi:hypothetical protein BDP27DRAFT_1430074 [Rhodocollybia butyracea]|uniref:Uncharacterized protein n=1 Tax=Rhodocollybia butyracea TaxID=206335 RepID=A0A9P5PAU2_9AGAR|nr:hypothetical protein BDP27DRAFT_1430074 [Rhodocollybia butyracea]
MSVLPLWQSDGEDEPRDSSVSSTGSPRSSIWDKLSEISPIIRQLDLPANPANPNFIPTCRPSIYDDPSGPTGGQVMGYFNLYVGALPGCFKVWEVSDRQGYIHTIWISLMHRLHGQIFLSIPKKIDAASLGVYPSELIAPNSTCTPRGSPSNTRLPEFISPMVTIQKPKKGPTITPASPSLSQAQKVRSLFQVDKAAPTSSMSNAEKSLPRSPTRRTWWAVHTKAFNVVVESSYADQILEEAEARQEEIILLQVSSIREAEGWFAKT